MPHSPSKTPIAIPIASAKPIRDAVEVRLLFVPMLPLELHWSVTIDEDQSGSSHRARHKQPSSPVQYDGVSIVPADL